MAEKLALIHNEFNVIHPFRDGNGRTIRLFLDSLVYTLGFDPINYGDREAYLAACITGAVQDNKAMQKLIESGLIKRKT
jgi:fido (protein-threonine AMPylation protein)